LLAAWIPACAGMTGEYKPLPPTVIPAKAGIQRIVRPQLRHASFPPKWLVPSSRYGTDADMRISDYLTGIPMCFHSPLSPETVASRINSASKSVLNPLGTGISGYSRFGRVMLGYRSIPHYNGQPRLTARLVPDGDATLIVGRFGAAGLHKLVFVLCYTLLTFLTVIWILGFLAGPSDGGFSEMPWFIPLILWAAPFALHFAFTAGWKAEMESIARFLEEEVDARSRI